MAQIGGAVEFRVDGEWYETINIGNLLLQHFDLNGCLFGVDNYGGFIPLFSNRGMPSDCSVTLIDRMSGLVDVETHPSWVTWKELASVDWSEMAAFPDQRISEFFEADSGDEALVAKWLSKSGMEQVSEALNRDPATEIRLGDRRFRRPVLRRSDALTDTDFPLVMKLMSCLAERFGEDNVRLVVWFG